MGEETEAQRDQACRPAFPELRWTPGQGGRGGQGTGCDQAWDWPSVRTTGDLPIGRGSRGQDRGEGLRAEAAGDQHPVQARSVKGPQAHCWVPTPAHTRWGSSGSAQLSSAHLASHTGVPWPRVLYVVAAGPLTRPPAMQCRHAGEQMKTPALAEPRRRRAAHPNKHTYAKRPLALSAEGKQDRRQSSVGQD